MIHLSQAQFFRKQPEVWLLVMGEGSQARGWGGRMWPQGHMVASQEVWALVLV